MRYIEDSVAGLELEEIKKRAAQSATQLAFDFNKKAVLNPDSSGAAKGAGASSTGEDNEAQVIANGASNDANRQGGGKKNRKKNKK